LISSSEYIYEGPESLISELISRDAEGIMVSRSFYQYDEDGNRFLNEFYMYDEEGNIIDDSYAKYSYNEKSDITFEAYWSDVQETYSECTYEYEYDSDDNVLVNTLYENGEFVKEYIYEYDNFGNLVYSASRVPHGSYEDRHEYVFEYGYKE
jgi:hypothetical protein